MQGLLFRRNSMRIRYKFLCHCCISGFLVSTTRGSLLVAFLFQVLYPFFAFLRHPIKLSAIFELAKLRNPWLEKHVVSLFGHQFAWDDLVLKAKNIPQTCRVDEVQGRVETKLSRSEHLTQAVYCIVASMFKNLITPTHHSKTPLTNSRTLRPISRRYAKAITSISGCKQQPRPVSVRFRGCNHMQSDFHHFSAQEDRSFKRKVPRSQARSTACWIFDPNLADNFLLHAVLPTRVNGAVPKHKFCILTQI